MLNTADESSVTKDDASSLQKAPWAADDGLGGSLRASNTSTTVFAAVGDCTACKHCAAFAVPHQSFETDLQQHLDTQHHRGLRSWVARWSDIWGGLTSHPEEVDIHTATQEEQKREVTLPTRRSPDICSAKELETEAREVQWEMSGCSERQDATRRWDSTMLVARKATTLFFSPSCIRIMRDYAISRRCNAAGGGTDSNLNLVPMLSSYQSLGQEITHPSALLFFLAAMVWMVLTAVTIQTSCDRYQRHVTSVAACVGVALATQTGTEFVSSCVYTVPWFIYAGLILSDTGHIAARACQLRTPRGRSMHQHTAHR